MRIYKVVMTFGMILFIVLGLLGCSEEGGDIGKQYYTITTNVESGSGQLAY